MSNEPSELSSSRLLPLQPLEISHAAAPRLAEAGPAPELVLVRTPPERDIGAPMRPAARGKFVFLGEEKFHVRGVTYGTFRPREDGSEFPAPDVVERDFTAMVASGINALRTYTVPPRWLLDAALRHGLRVLVGLPVERHVGYLIDRKGAPDTADVVRAGVAACASHAAVLGYAVGNEIPAAVARWHGRSRIERFLERLYRAAKAEDPAGLVTYVNYPSTEYLQLPFLDLVCFNVFLETQAPLAAYLARLHHVAGDRPLLVSEVGHDSLRHGEDAQARTLDWQIRTSFAEGCAGVFVYAWTDEWHRAGEDVLDWQFGLTRRDRQPKPALEAARAAFADTPFSADLRWPRVSVVLCSYNGSRTIRECLDGLGRLHYPDFEVIVVDDGSIDTTAAIAQQYDVRLIRTENCGLSSARNTGWRAATGEIIAYVDDDAYPDPDWLRHLAATFLRTTDVGVGGPNIAPRGDGPIARCIAHAPGNPVHVMLSDREAEHIPGCNMAFRRDALEAIGGFDEQFRVAGDDVDVCWRLRERGWTLGFSPAAVVWHHRRNSVRTFWKQQVGYGRAEGLLERKWPEKYTATGQIAWTGRLYGSGLPPLAPWRGGRIYHGMWGFAPFQRLYQPAPTWLGSLALAPEWYLPIAVLAVVAGLGIAWSPLRLAFPLLLLATLPLLGRAVIAARDSFPRSRPTRRIRQRLVTAWLHLLHPLARLYGRLTRPAIRRRRRHTWPWPGKAANWCERWREPGERLNTLQSALRETGAAVLRGGDFERWDLQVRGGALGSARLLMAVEEHGGGRQLVRIRWWPSLSPAGPALALLLAGLAVAAGSTRAWLPGTAFGGSALWCAWRAFGDCGAAVAAIRLVVERVQERMT
ncbi:MAG: glycosyltransferase [Gemmatimonadales bacterium]